MISLGTSLFHTHDNLKELPFGIHSIKSQPGGLALDYIRGNIVDPRLFVPIPMNVPGPDNDSDESLTTMFSEPWLMKTQNLCIWFSLGS